MAKQKKSKASNEEAIRLAKAEIGEEAIAILQGLPPEVRAALGSALVASAKLKNPGGRPKGTGRNHTPALERMAELQEAEPGLGDIPAAKRVEKEMKAAGLDVGHWDTLRKAYRFRRDELRAAIRKRKAAAAPPRFKVAVTADLAEPVPEGAASWTTMLADAAKAIAGPLGQSPDEFMRRLGVSLRPPELLGNYMNAEAHLREMALGVQLRNQQAIEAVESLYASMNLKNARAIAAFEAQYDKIRKSAEAIGTIEAAGKAAIERLGLVSEEARHGVALMLGQKPKK